MAEPNARDLERLKGVDTVLAAVTLQVIRRHSVECHVSEGLRTKERQRELVAAGKSRTLDSKHLTGHAVDLVVMPSMCAPSSRFASPNRPSSSGPRQSTAATRLSCGVCGLLLASTLVACTTVTPPAPVTPSALQEAPPAGDFRMRLERFFDPRPTGQTN